MITPNLFKSSHWSIDDQADEKIDVFDFILESRTDYSTGGFNALMKFEGINGDKHQRMASRSYIDR